MKASAILILLIFPKKVDHVEVSLHSFVCSFVILLVAARSLSVEKHQTVFSLRCPFHGKSWIAAYSLRSCETNKVTSFYQETINCTSRSIEERLSVKDSIKFSLHGKICTLWKLIRNTCEWRDKNHQTCTSRHCKMEACTGDVCEEYVNATSEWITGERDFNI